MTTETKLREAALLAIDRFCEGEGFPVPPMEEIVTTSLKRRVDFFGKSPDGREFAIGYETVGAAMIPWRPIAELPDELKDGREVLLWTEPFARPGIWFGGGWMEANDGYEIEPTHYSEINGPGETARSCFEAFCRKEGLAFDDPAAQLRWMMVHGQQWLPPETHFAEINAPGQPDVELDSEGQLVWARDVKEGEIVSIPAHLIGRARR